MIYDFIERLALRLLLWLVPNWWLMPENEDWPPPTGERDPDHYGFLTASGGEG